MAGICVTCQRSRGFSHCPSPICVTVGNGVSPKHAASAVINWSNVWRVPASAFSLAHYWPEPSSHSFKLPLPFTPASLHKIYIHLKDLSSCSSPPHNLSSFQKNSVSFKFSERGHISDAASCIRNCQQCILCNSHLVREAVFTAGIMKFKISKIEQNYQNFPKRSRKYF